MRSFPREIFRKYPQGSLMSWAEYTLASYDESKDDNPVVVLGHGFGCDSTCWHNLKPLLLRRGYGVLTYDLPYARTSQSGAFTESPNRRKTFRTIFEKFIAAVTASPRVETPHGAKSFDFQRYSILGAYSDDLICILDELRISGCVFVGHSVSGMIGLSASTKRPDLFRRVIMLASSPRYINDPSTDYVGGFQEEQVRDLLLPFAVKMSRKSARQMVASGMSDDAIGQALQRSRRTLQRHLKKVGFTLKKATKAYCEFNEERGHAFLTDIQADLGPHLLSLDECGFFMNHVRGYAWSQRGTRAVVKRLGPRGKKFSLLLCISSTGVVKWNLYQGSVDSVRFLEFLQELPMGSKIVLDNAAIHKSTNSLSAEGCQR
ncbi:hypothetical protein KFL_007940050 [Klebsormidium nitens]|uniref:AB hydrolase-1 domain-containing protein n=1 Tax=Klebsormidium nitens TaxID=105231 RepID=A0A1Y1IS63_KLENI|nr:hypothetical protein KFL_007940050 [Klebsormidium nitens]|eukprot:GAQ91487.1 hypothetical protein KFL_007940050 [Klebsormidium nitens]